jgi:nicotinic acid mononucleotide adenylyltransferase
VALLVRNVAAPFVINLRHGSIMGDWEGERILREGTAAGQRVAILTMVGTFCPVTLGHVEAFVQAREILLGRADTAEGVRIDEPFDFVLGIVGFNRAERAEWKLTKNKELPPKGARAGISKEDRAGMMDLATQDLPWMNPRGTQPGTGQLLKRFPALTFVDWELNGADDVAKYEKWNDCDERNRFLTLGRPGHTEAVRAGIARCGADPRWCVLAPELPDISSTAARAALRLKDMVRLQGLLDRRVIDWCTENRAYGFTEPTDANGTAKLQAGVGLTRASAGQEEADEHQQTPTVTSTEAATATGHHVATTVTGGSAVCFWTAALGADRGSLKK